MKSSLGMLGRTSTGKMARGSIAILVGVVVLWGPRGLASPCRCQCPELRTSFPGNVFLSLPANSHLNSSDAVAEAAFYDALNTNRWSNTSILAPACIFRPQSAVEVAAGLDVLTRGGCKFALKSGGHMSVPNANNIDGQGVSVDLGALNETTVAGDRSYVRLGVGARWGQAYDALGPKGLGFPGGLCGQTGVGGVSLGGGQSAFQASRGWLVDNVLQFEVVLAGTAVGSARVVQASAAENPDLFRALKGGSSNFGIVTRVDVAAFDLGNVYAGEVLIPVTDADVTKSVLQAMTNYTALNNVDVDTAAQALLLYPSDGGVPSITIAMTNVKGVKNSLALQPLEALGPLGRINVGLLPYHSFIRALDSVQPDGYRELAATVTFVNDAQTIMQVQAVTDAVYQTVKHIPNLDYLFIYTPQPKATNAHSTQAGGNVLGLAGTHRDLMVFLLNPRWLDAAYDDDVNKALQQWVAGVTKVTKALGTDDGFLYLNFAAGFQKPLCSYGAKNVAFMKEVASKYDPDQVFQKLVPGGFKISQAC